MTILEMFHQNAILTILVFLGIIIFCIVFANKKNQMNTSDKDAAGPSEMPHKTSIAAGMALPPEHIAVISAAIAEHKKQPA